jgi:hypothetical protein
MKDRARAKKELQHKTSENLKALVAPIPTFGFDTIGKSFLISPVFASRSSFNSTVVHLEFHLSVDF